MSAILMNPQKRKTPKRKTVKRRARRPTVTVRATANPVRRRRRSPVKRRTIGQRRVKRNPSTRGIQGMIKATLYPSLIAAGGATALDVAVGYAASRLPPTLMTGVGATAVRFGGAIAMGFIGEKLQNKKFGEQLMMGGLTVTMYGLARDVLQRTMPAVPLAAIDDPYFTELGAYDRSMGAYDMGAISYSELGYDEYAVGGLAAYSPAHVSGEPPEPDNYNMML